MIELSGSGGVKGAAASGFEAVIDAFASVIADDPDYSAHFCAYHRGVPVVDIWAGHDASADRIQGVFSATKGMAGACIAMLIDRGALDLDSPVMRYWPEFARAGKTSITVRAAMSHQAGVVGVEPQVPLAVVLDHDEMARRLADQMPLWRPGGGMGYHALTIGTIVDELIRRVTGMTAADFFAQEIALPRSIDAFIAVPDSEESRVDLVLPVRDGPARRARIAPGEDSSLTGLAFNAALFDPFDPPLGNIRAARASGHAAVGGAASARGLARMYASLTETVDGRPPLVSGSTVAAVSQLQVASVDLVLGIPARYAVVFQKADERLAYGSHRAFGHDGAGGAFGVADPEYRLAFGYVPRRLSDPAGADPRGLALAAAVRHSVVAAP